MARRARIHYPGAVYRGMLLGNGGQDILFDESDGLRFHGLSDEGGKRFDVRIPALRSMSNYADGIGSGYGGHFQ